MSLGTLQLAGNAQDRKSYIDAYISIVFFSGSLPQHLHTLSETSVIGPNFAPALFILSRAVAKSSLVKNSLSFE